ncbi:MAG TPA: hypothetical protein VHY58_08910 [Streptosporangiaceae bacterium]|nr:hypothetical protein [Streptosporangiaceae bacterium]
MPKASDRRSEGVADFSARLARVSEAALADPPTSTQIWTITELWDFGVTADITAPRPDEVVAPRDVTWDEPDVR